jgi:hypothetical protein
LQSNHPDVDESIKTVVKAVSGKENYHRGIKINFNIRKYKLRFVPVGLPVKLGKIFL